MLTFLKRGNYDFDAVEFDVLPHALRAIFPKDKGSGRRAPRADFSNLSHIIPATYMDLKVRSFEYTFWLHLCFLFLTRI